MERRRSGSGGAIEERLILKLSWVNSLGLLREGHWEVWGRAGCSMTIRDVVGIV